MRQIKSTQPVFTPATNAAYYVLMSPSQALSQYPNAMKGTAFPEGENAPLLSPIPNPADIGKTFAYDALPGWLDPNMKSSFSLTDQTLIETTVAMDVTIKPARAAKLPDIFMVKTPIVSSKARAALEAYQPDLAYFFPAHLTNSSTTEAIDGSWWGCVPRRRFFVQTKPNFDFDLYLASTCSATALERLHWIEGALEHVSRQFPLIQDIGAGLCMNPALFKHLNLAGLTGLTEIPPNGRELFNAGKRNDIYDHRKEFVGHIHWNRHGRFIA